MPGLLAFSLRLPAEVLSVPVRRVLRVLGIAGREADRYEPVAEGRRHAGPARGRDGIP